MLSGKTNKRLSSKGVVTDVNLKSNLISENTLFHEMSYSDVLQDFIQFIHDVDITFNRGAFDPYYAWSNVSYMYDPDTTLRRQTTKVQDFSLHKDGVFLGNTITSTNPLIVLPLHAAYLVGEIYPQTGQNVNSIARAKNVVAQDVRGVGTYAYCNLDKKDAYENAQIPLRFTITQAFRLSVPLDSVLADTFEIPVEPGHEYTCLAAAQMAILHNLSEGQYRLRYGGRGMAGYACDTVLDVFIEENSSRNLKVNISRPADPEGMVEF